MMIAHGDQPVVLDDEGDWRGFRPVILAAADESGGHEGRAILLVEAARGFDLGQFFAGRNIDAERLLDGRFLKRRRLDQIDPYGIGGYDGRAAGGNSVRQPLAVP